jgi:ATP-binding cassette subfamily B protein
MKPEIEDGDDLILPKTVAGFFWRSIREPKILVWYVIMFASTAVMVTMAMSFSNVVRKITVLAATQDGAPVAPEQLYRILFQIASMLAVITTANFLYRLGWLHGRVNMEMGAKRFLLRYAVKHSHSYFTDNHTGRIAQKIHELPWHNMQLSHALIREVFPGISVLTIANIWLYSVHRDLGLIMTAWTVVFLSIAYCYAVYHSKLAHNRAEAKGRTMGALVDSMANHAVVRMFARRGYELDHLNDFIDREHQATFRLISNDRFIEMVRDIPFSVLVLTLLYRGMTLFGAGAIQLGDLAFLTTIVLVFMQFLQYFTNGIIHLFEEGGGVREGLDLLGKPLENQDRDDVPALAVTDGAVVFDNVCFSYNAKIPALNGFTLAIKPGEKIGLIGPSGAGKSTVVSLLMRFFDAPGQNVTIDGQNIYNVTQDSLRRAVAVIPQDTSLFHRSLLENIRYGRLDATDEEVIAAAKKAYAHDFITALPEGYQTLVGERGVKLSGGQRQRIAIARAILKNAPILILDEATSALDSESEAAIQASLRDLMKGKTVIAIAHRLSTIAHLDRLVVMEQGRIVEEGAHGQLQSSQGLYAKLWSMQSGGFLGVDKQAA